MATQHPHYGWVWRAEEREARQLPVRQAQMLVAVILQQVCRIGVLLRPFQDQAEAAFRHLKDGLGEVADLSLRDLGPQYLPLSPEETDRILATLPDLLKPWTELTSNPEFAAAVQRKNRQVQALAGKVGAEAPGVAPDDNCCPASMQPALKEGLL